MCRSNLHIFIRQSVNTFEKIDLLLLAKRQNEVERRLRGTVDEECLDSVPLLSTLYRLALCVYDDGRRYEPLIIELLLQ